MHCYSLEFQIYWANGIVLHDDSFGRLLISNTSHVLGFEVEYESIMPRGNGNINKETDCGNTIEQYILYISNIIFIYTIKNNVYGCGNLQLHFQMCSFRKCKSQKCKNKKKFSEAIDLKSALLKV